MITSCRISGLVVGLIFYAIAANGDTSAARLSNNDVKIDVDDPIARVGALKVSASRLVPYNLHVMPADCYGAGRIFIENVSADMPYLGVIWLAAGHNREEVVAINGKSVNPAKYRKSILVLERGDYPLRLRLLRADGRSMEVEASQFMSGDPTKPPSSNSSSAGRTAASRGPRPNP